MSLETLIDRNPIVQKIGEIEDPFKPPDTTTRYLITVQHLVRLHKGQETLDEMIDTIISNHLPSITDRDGFLRYVNNEHHQVNAFLYILFMEYGKEILQIEDIYRFVGRNTINPMFLQIAAGESLGLNFIYEQVAKLTPNFTTVRVLEYDSDNSRKGFAVIRSRTLDDYKGRVMETFHEDLSPIVLKNDCLLTQGVLEAGPKVVNFDNDFARVVEEPYCESRKDAYCEHLIEWDTKPHIEISKISVRSPRSMVNAVFYIVGGLGKAATTKIINNIPAVRKYIDSILQMEVIIQRNAEEIQREAQARIQAERTTAIKETELKLEQSFSGGLAHEVRNALFDGSVEIADLSRLEVPDISSLDGIIGKLGATIFDLESRGVPHDVIYKTLLPMLQEIDDLSKRSSAVLEKYSKATPTIKNSIGRGLVLAEQFLRYSKMQEIERGEEEINVYVVARKIGEKYEKAFGDSGIRYTIDSPQGEELIVKGDYIQLEQILENPILNAKDALAGKAGEIGISLSKKDDSVNIIVKDTGEGIPEENMKKVFDPFFSTKGSKGTGLGLKFVKKLVEAYGGSISLKSKVGMGTHVYISLRP